MPRIKEHELIAIELSKNDRICIKNGGWLSFRIHVKDAKNEINVLIRSKENSTFDQAMNQPGRIMNPKGQG